MALAALLLEKLAAFRMDKRLQPEKHKIESVEDVELADLEGPKTATTTPSRARSLISNVVLFPSWKALTTDEQAQKRLAYLDGLRGVAALLVYCIHNQGWSHPELADYYRLDNAFGWNGQYTFATLPGIRLIFTGGLLAVSIFFVISGYVLSYSPLRSIQSGDRLKLGNTLSSALFRRWFRLFLPVAATTFIYMTLWHALGIRSSQPIHKPESTYGKELYSWYKQIKNYSFIYHSKPWLGYNDHAWSISYEFRGSIVVYTMLLAFSRTKHHVRLCLHLTLVWYFTYVVDGWYLSLFCMGMFLSDLDMLSDANKLPLPKLFNLLSRWKTKVAVIAMLTGIYLGGVPGTGEFMDNLQQNPGWYWLSLTVPSAITDPRRFFHLLAATLIMASIPRIAVLKRSLESRCCQYLGKISYGFYLVHGPILWTIGDRVYAALGRKAQHHVDMVPAYIDLCPLPSWGPLGLEVNHVAAQVLLLPFTIWVADLVTVHIDEPSVRFAAWLLRTTDEDDCRKQPGARLV